MQMKPFNVHLGTVMAMLYTWMITINNYYRDYKCAVSFVSRESDELVNNPMVWIFHSLEHFAWTALSILIPSLIIRSVFKLI